MMSDIQADLKSVAKVLESADSIGVVGHVGPDGDALGSMIGLARSARLAGKNAVASFDEPFVMPEEMSFLDSSVLVPPREFPRDLDVAVVVVDREEGGCEKLKELGVELKACIKASQLKAE